MPAKRSYRSYRSNSSAVAKNLQKLSSGYKINNAADDAAGLAISEKMRAQITGLDRAQTNAKEGIGLVQTGESALEELHEMARRLLELNMQSQNGTYQDDIDRTELQKELEQICDEISRITEVANFNGIPLFQDDGYDAEVDVSMLADILQTSSGSRALSSILESTPSSAAPLRASAAFGRAAHRRTDARQPCESNIYVDDRQGIQGYQRQHPRCKV